MCRMAMSGEDSIVGVFVSRSCRALEVRRRQVYHPGELRSSATGKGREEEEVESLARDGSIGQPRQHAGGTKPEPV